MLLQTQVFGLSWSWSPLPTPKSPETTDLSRCQTQLSVPRVMEAAFCPPGNTSSRPPKRGRSQGAGPRPQSPSPRVGGERCVPEGVGRSGLNSRDKSPLWRQPAGLPALHLGSTKNTFCVFLLFLSLGLFQGENYKEISLPLFQRQLGLG